MKYLLMLAALTLSAATCATPVEVTTEPWKLFEPDRPGNSFAYAPSSISDGANDYHFYCGSKGGDEIRDHAYLAHFRNDNGWLLVSDTPVLSPTPGAWDSKHICDPDVVAGDFGYNGKSYKWAMFYLGTQDPENVGGQNQIGLAFSNNLHDWVKLPTPVVERRHDGWGTGQPSVTAVGDGKVLLFYTRASTPGGTYALQADLSNGFNVVTPEWRIPDAGLTAESRGTTVLHAADFAYDAKRDRFVVVRPAEFDRDESPGFIASEVELAWMSGRGVWSGSGAWTSLGVVTRNETGYAKNHNAGISTDKYGHLPPGDQVRLNITMSPAGPWPWALWQYRIHSMFVSLTP